MAFFAGSSSSATNPITDQEAKHASKQSERKREKGRQRQQRFRNRLELRILTAIEYKDIDALEGLITSAVTGHADRILIPLAQAALYELRQARPRADSDDDTSGSEDDAPGPLNYPLSPADGPILSFDSS